MAWLDDHPPARSQFRHGRRARLRPVIVVHTAESILDSIGPDTGAENVANYIRTRDTPGSYHRLVDSDSIMALVDLGNEAYHDGTGSNPWSMGLSYALRTTDWRRLSDEDRAAFIANGARAAAEMSAFSIREGVGPIPARRITKAQSDAGVAGFLPHGDRDPGRRTDPGDDYPWDEFFAAYRTATGATPPPAPPKGILMALTDKEQEELLAKVRRIDTKTTGIEKAIKATRAWVISVAELVAGNKSPADLAKRAKELNK